MLVSWGCIGVWGLGCGVWGRGEEGSFGREFEWEGGRAEDLLGECF